MPLTVEQTVRLLTTADVSALVNAALILQARTPDEYPGAFCLAPVIDGRLVPRHPIAAFRDGTAHRVPLIIGTNDREGTIFRKRIDILPRSASRIEAVLARGTAESRDLIARAYPGLPGGALAPDFGGDYAFWYPCIAVAERHSRYAPVYFYRFDVAPRLMRWAGLDATHGLEMFALFEQTDAPLARRMTSLGGRKVFSSAGERMRDAWLDFAASGAPPEWWPRYGERDRLTLIIADHDRVESDPRAARRQAWSALLPLG